MRNLVAALFSLVFGIVLGVPGILLALWVGIAMFQIERAFDWVLWAAAHSPLPLTVPPLQLANDAIQRPSLIAAGIGAAFLCWAAFSNLRSARQSLRPADESRDGKARIALKAEHPRVGRPLEGSLRLFKNPKPDDVFRLELSCRRTYSSGDEDRVETLFFEQREAQPFQTAEGWSVPFRFDVPVTAPASIEGDLLAGDPYRWRLAFYPAKAWIAVPTEFALKLGPAPAEELRAIEASETRQQKEAIDAIARDLSRPYLGRKSLLPHERAQLRALSPDDLTKARKVAGMLAKIMKWEITMRWSDVRRPSAIALVAVNLVPVYGVLAWDWSALSLLAIYWAETVVIGVFSLLRVLFAHPASLGLWFVKLFALPFLPLFLLPFVMAVTILGAIVFGLFGTDTTGRAFASILLAPSGHKDLMPLDQAVQVLGLSLDTGIAVAALAASHLVSFFWNYIVRGECNRIGFVALILLPVLRNLLVLTVVSFAMLGADQLGAPVWMLVPLIGVKIALDLFTHLMEHRTQPPG